MHWVLNISFNPFTSSATGTLLLCLFYRWRKPKLTVFAQGQIARIRPSQDLNTGLFDSRDWTLNYKAIYLQFTKNILSLWSRKWQPIPVFLPGKFPGQRSFTDYSPWSRKELGMTEHAYIHAYYLWKSFTWISSLFPGIKLIIDLEQLMTYKTRSLLFLLFVNEKQSILERCCS